MNRSGRNYRSYYPSSKMSRMIHCESILERDAAHMFEKSEKVFSYYEQPQVVQYAQDEVIKTYFPDFLLILEQGEFLIEIKPSAKLEEPKIIKKFNAIKNHFFRNHINFLIFDENVIRGPSPQQQFDLMISNHLVK